MSKEYKLEKPSYYAIIPANVRYDKDLKPNAKLLYGEISCLCNSNGHCWATNSYFAELYGVTKETISRLISQLAAKGYIKIVITYLETGEIDKRYISIAPSIPIDLNVNIDEKINRGIDKKIMGGIDEKIMGGIDEKINNNNTSNINNTSNNNTSNNIKEKNIKKENEVENTYYDETKKDENVEIFEFWNSKKIIVHRNLTDSMKKRIKSKLKKYTVDEIKEAINVYSVILNDSNCIFSYKWSLEDFLTGEDRMKKFLKGGTHYENYFKPNNTQPKKTYTTNVPNKNNSNNFENVKSEYVPDYKKNFNPIYHDPKSHANFEISDTMKQLTTNSEFASEFENKALGFDEFDEDDDINPFTGQKRNTSGIVCKQTIENTNQNQF